MFIRKLLRLEPDDMVDPLADDVRFLLAGYPNKRDPLRKSMELVDYLIVRAAGEKNPQLASNIVDQVFALNFQAFIQSIQYNYYWPCLLILYRIEQDSPQ